MGCRALKRSCAGALFKDSTEYMTTAWKRAFKRELFEQCACIGTALGSGLRIELIGS